MSVCALEYESLSKILGPSAVAAARRQRASYTWIYSQIIANPGWFSGFLQRHGLQVPGQSPVPPRYFGEVWPASCGSAR